MVAWELGAVEEKAAHSEEAAKWYTIAAQRFRRSDWKKKAEEALTRLGVPLPLEASRPAETAQEHSPEEAEAHEPAEEAIRSPQSDIPQHEPEYEPQTRFFGSADIDQRRDERLSAEAGDIPPSNVRTGPPPQQPVADGGEEAGRRRRRRGRRGGRGRRRGSAGGTQGLPSQAYAPSAEPRGARGPRGAEEERGGPARPIEQPPAGEEAAHESHRAVGEQAPIPQLPSERMAHGRAGDPGLASRMTHLDSLLRRLLGGALHRVSEAEEAPAGPGVFLLSDSDQTTAYYVEACQTLRVGIANVVRGRGGRGRPGGRGFAEIDLKEKLAEHLGISEAKVAQYVKDHCVVRWIQLDDEAPQLAHFAIAVLRTPVNLG